MNRRGRIDRKRLPRNRRRAANVHPALEGLPRDLTSLPLVRAYVPMPDAWRASGYGTAGVIRSRPNGRTISTFVQFSLIAGGIEHIYGLDDHPLGEVEQFLNSLTGNVPPIEVGPEELARDFIAGAYALSQLNDFEWEDEGELVRRYLSLMRPRTDDPADWLNRLLGHGGLAPAKLWRHIAKVTPARQVPLKGKETAIATVMKFHGIDPESVGRLLSENSDEFAPAPAATARKPALYWMRERRAAPGTKIPHAEIILRQKLVQATVGTLSMASLLTERFHRLTGGALRLKDVTWTDCSVLPFELPGKTIVT